MKRLLSLLLVVSAFNWSVASAAVSDEEFAELRRQLAAVSQRLDALEAENAELRRSHAQTETVVADVQTSVATVNESSGESWTDRIVLNGDFRYRYENIDADGSPTRERNRIRARFNTVAELTDDLEVGFGLYAQLRVE